MYLFSHFPNGCKGQAELGPRPGVWNTTPGSGKGLRVGTVRDGKRSSQDSNGQPYRTPVLQQRRFDPLCHVAPMATTVNTELAEVRSDCPRTTAWQAESS